MLYINGIAVGVLKLKNSRVSIGDGIRQNLSNQESEFNEWFFPTIQIVFAGNDTKGLRYGTVGTLEKYFLQWKEDEQDNVGYKLNKYLKKLCAKERLLELIHDFVLFDGGIKTAALPPVLWHQGRAAACETLPGRHHLADPRQRQEYRAGAAGQVDTREQSKRSRRHHHRSRRVG